MSTVFDPLEFETKEMSSDLYTLFTKYVVVEPYCDNECGIVRCMDGEESEGESSAEKLRRYLAERGATGLCIDETIRSIATGQVQVLVDHSDDDWLRLNFDEGDYEEFVSLIDESEDDEFIEDEYSTDCCRSLMIQHAILKLAELLDELGQEDPSLQDDLAKALRL